MIVHRITDWIGTRKRFILPLLLAALLLTVFFSRQEGGRASGVADSVSGPKILVLNYHKVDRMNHPLSIPPADFEHQMAFLAQNGYHTITPHELYMAFTDGGDLPTNPVLITFDDGYADNYTYAYPLLKKYGF